MFRSSHGFILTGVMVLGIFISLGLSASLSPNGLDEGWWAMCLGQFAATLAGGLLILLGLEISFTNSGPHSSAISPSHPYDLLQQAKQGNVDALLLLRQQNLLHGQQLGKARWDEVNLAQADLKNSDLEHALLNRAILQEADLSHANLSHAMMDSTNLRNAALVETDLRWANMPKAALTHANLESALLYEANLQGANMRWAILAKADMRGANLREADLHAANLCEADLHAAHLQRARLARANCQAAKLQEANLQAAILIGADLRGANLMWANLVDADLSNCLFDNATVLPDSKRWRENTNLERFTDPAHPQFYGDR